MFGYRFEAANTLGLNKVGTYKVDRLLVFDKNFRLVWPLIAQNLEFRKIPDDVSDLA